MRGRCYGAGGLGGRWLLLFCLPLALATPVPAQETGQVCVQSFVDQDADGRRAADETAIGHGIVAGLENTAGVTIASLLLEDSPYAAEGLLCFDALPAGDYRITLRSVEFADTAGASFPASVEPGAAPMLVEYGVQPQPVVAPSRSRAEPADAVNARLRAFAASLIMIVITGAIGLLICLAVIRRRSKRALAPPASAPPEQSDA